MTHWDEDGKLKMVSVSDKKESLRTAIVRGRIMIKPAHFDAISGNPKGDVLAAARLAGIQAAKRCWELIPLCHQVPLSSVEIEFKVEANAIDIQVTATAFSVTGVEMEGYCAAAVAGLTLIDMLKGVDPELSLTDIQLIKKTGGKSDFNRD